MSERWDRLRSGAPPRERTSPLTLMHDPNVVLMSVLERREGDARGVVSRLGVTTMHTYMQMTSLTDPEIHTALSRWRVSDVLWSETPYDVKLFVMCAEVMCTPPRYTLPPSLRVYAPTAYPRNSRGCPTLLMSAYCVAKSLCGGMPAYTCPCGSPPREVAEAACAGARAGIDDVEAREAARSAVELMKVFNVDGKPISELVCAGLPEWARPLSDVEPMKWL